VLRSGSRARICAVSRCAASGPGRAAPGEHGGYAGQRRRHVAAQHPAGQPERGDERWAQVTARPVSLSIRPGEGGGLACHGPGTVYDTLLSAQGQYSSCAWTYEQPSAGLPGSRYQASVTVTWTAAWEGSGGASGALPPLGRTTTFGLAVGEAQALIQGS